MTLEEFSGGYYRAMMDVQPYDGGPVIQDTLYEMIDRRVYRQTDAPITMRVGFGPGAHFGVSAETSIPANVLALPAEWLDDMGIGNSTGTSNVFVLKPAQSYIFNQSAELNERFVNEPSE